MATYYIKNCIAYLAKAVTWNDNFKSIARVKTDTMLQACGQEPDYDNDSFLVISSSIISFGLQDYGANVTIFDGIHKFGEEEFTGEMYDGDLEDFIAHGRKFDWVIAPEEWLTWAETEEDQIHKLSIISKITRKGFFTTLKDYKNMYANQRYFEEPFVLRSNTGDSVIIRRREWDNQDRQSWNHLNYIICGEDLFLCPVTRRRTMYFKQIAKFSSDLGATQFSVEKDTMYKPVFSKSFEYVICISF